MRPGQNKRMRGRNRRGPNPLTRSYESNGPDVKVRGTAQHIAEKYTQLARDAHLSGDPVAAESYLQHAEHYYRLIATAVQAQQAALSGQADDRDDDDDDFDPSSDRFTFRAPQAMQQQNGNGYGPGGERQGGEFASGEQPAEGEGGEGQPMPPRMGGEGGFQPRRRARIAVAVAMIATVTGIATASATMSVSSRRVARRSRSRAPASSLICRLS